MASIVLFGTFGGLTGCMDFGNKEDESDGSSVIKATVVQNGSSNYVIVYPATSTATEKEVADLIREKIYQVTDVRLKMESEEFLTKVDGAHYIYIGNTTFDAAVAAKQAISEKFFDAYEADAVGDDIYFVGASDQALLNAATYFVENLVEKNYDADTKTLCFEGFRFDGEKLAPMGFSKENIREYVIVYAADWPNARNMAKRLQEIIDAKAGVALNVYSDKEISERAFEILIGETNRPTSARCYEGTSRIMEYEYVVEGNKLQLAIGGSYSGEKCIAEFSKLMSNDGTMTSGSYYKKDMATVHQSLTSGSDVRIMSANVLAYRWGEASYSNVLPTAQRAEIFAGVLLNYTPDAVGAQELDDPWKQVLPWYLERMATKDNVEYSYEHSTASVENKTMINFSAILYRSDLYNIEETGCRVYSIWEKTPNYFQRVASYVKLTSKTDSTKQFALVNTHWAHEDHETVNACAVEQAALVNELKAKYPGVSVFCTGDYNNLSTREWGDTYLNQLVSDIGGRIASNEARSKGVLITPGGCRASAKNMHENVMREVDNDFIDHIVCSGGAIAIKRHDTIRANGCHILSDHSPIYADIDLK